MIRPKGLNTIKNNVVYMTELRKVRNVGGSLALTIPKSMGFKQGEWIKFEKRGDEVVMVRIDVE